MSRGTHFDLRLRIVVLSFKKNHHPADPSVMLPAKTDFLSFCSDPNWEQETYAKLSQEINHKIVSAY